MRRVSSSYLDDGRGFNHGQPATLIEVEDDDDLDALHDTIVRTNYYSDEYFTEHGGYQEGTIVGHFWYLAEIARHLRPRRVLEVGCGRGDVLELLRRAGVEAHGIDFSSDIVARAWPGLRPTMRCGDLLEVLDAQVRHQPHLRFDLVCGFDIWEHLPPRRLDDYVERAVEVTSEDALFLFVVPAFGDDPVFGEQFPLEFEENREAFERREPFRFMVTDKVNGAVPAQGHLTWAHTDWWTSLFRSHGLVRMPAVERPFHDFLDDLLPHSVRSFYLFRRDTPAAAERARQLEGRPYGKVAFTATVARLFSATPPVGPVTFDRDVKGQAVEVWRARLESRVRGTVAMARQGLAPLRRARGDGEG